MLRLDTRTYITLPVVFHLAVLTDKKLSSIQYEVEIGC